LVMLSMGLLSLLLPSNVTAGDLGFAEIEDLEFESYSPGLEVVFNAVEHSEIVLYMWNFGDGSDIEMGRSVNHTYDDYDTYTVKLMCMNEDGEWDNDTLKVKVRGVFYSEDMVVQVCCASACLAPFIAPFLLLVGLAIGTKFLLQHFTKRDWSIKSLTMAGLLIICIPLYCVFSLFLFFLPIGTLFVNVIVGSGVWILTGLVTVFIVAMGVKLLSKMPFFGLKDGLCIVRKALPIQKKQSSGIMKFSKKNYIDFVLELSLYPVFLAFFLMSLVSMDVKHPLDFLIWQNFIIVAFAPLVTFIILPIQILLDSNLMFVRKDPRTGIFIVYLGASIRNLLQGLLGVGAIVAFMGIFLNFGSGGELDQMMWGLFFMILIVVMVFPNVFLVAIVYGFFHNKFVKMTNNRLDKLNLPEYRIKEHKEDKRYIAMVPIEYQTWTMEKIRKSLSDAGPPLPTGVGIPQKPPAKSSPARPPPAKSPPARPPPAKSPPARPPPPGKLPLGKPPQAKLPPAKQTK